MIDINFYMYFHELNKRLLAREYSETREELYGYLESIRQKKPIVYNMNVIKANLIGLMAIIVS